MNRKLNESFLTLHAKLSITNMKWMATVFFMKDIKEEKPSH